MQRTNFFEFNRGVRQGCILSPILFNLYFNELPHILDSQDTDPVTLPNGLPLNCLLHADDLVLISISQALWYSCVGLLLRLFDERSRTNPPQSCKTYPQTTKRHRRRSKTVLINVNWIPLKYFYCSRILNITHRAFYNLDF